MGKRFIRFAVRRAARALQAYRMQLPCQKYFSFICQRDRNTVDAPAGNPSRTARSWEKFKCIKSSSYENILSLLRQLICNFAYVLFCIPQKHPIFMIFHKFFFNKKGICNFAYPRLCSGVKQATSASPPSADRKNEWRACCLQNFRRWRSASRRPAAYPEERA